MSGRAARPAAGIRRILWLTTTLNQVGGGERLLLEGVRCFRERGIDTLVTTFQFHERALFDGRYEASIVTLLDAEPGTARGAPAQAAYWTRGLAALIRTIGRFQPDLLIAQSENSAVLLDLATRFAPRPYLLFLFGQMYQFAEDRTKYARVFHRHLPAIRASLPGYQELIPPAPPRLGPGAWLRNEAQAAARYLAVRRAVRIITPSEQVRWEVGRLYGRDALALQGAYPANIFAYQPPPDLRLRLGLPTGPIILTIARLIPKKRVDLCLRAFAWLAAEAPDTTLVIGGRGPEEPALRQLAADLGLRDRVHFAGYIPDDRLWDVHAAADVFVQLDRADFDIVTLESLSLGRQVVISTEADLDPDLAGSRFVTAAAPEVEAVVAALRKALAAPAAPPTPAEREPLARYTWENYFDRVLAALDVRPAAPRRR